MIRLLKSEAEAGGRRQETEDEGWFQTVSFNVQNVHPRPDESGHPRRETVS